MTLYCSLDFSQVALWFEIFKRPGTSILESEFGPLNCLPVNCITQYVDSFLDMAASRDRRSNAGNKMSRLLEAEDEDEFYQTTYGGFNEVFSNIYL